MRNADAHIVLKLQVRLDANVDAEAFAQNIEKESKAKGARISLHKDDASTQRLELELVGPQFSEAELRAQVFAQLPDLDPSAIQITRLDDVQVQDLDPDLHEAAHLEDPASAKAAVESLLKARGEEPTVEISDVDGHRQIKIESHKQE